MEQFIFYLLDSTINFFGAIVLITIQEILRSWQNAVTFGDLKLDSMNRKRNKNAATITNKHSDCWD